MACINQALYDVFGTTVYCLDGEDMSITYIFTEPQPEIMMGRPWKALGGIMLRSILALILVAFIVPAHAAKDIGKVARLLTTMDIRFASTPINSVIFMLVPTNL